MTTEGKTIEEIIGDCENARIPVNNIEGEEARKIIAGLTNALKICRDQRNTWCDLASSAEFTEMQNRIIIYETVLHRLAQTDTSAKAPDVHWLNDWRNDAKQSIQKALRDAAAVEIETENAESKSDDDYQLVLCFGGEA